MPDRPRRLRGDAPVLAITQGWSITLGWRDILTIVSSVLAADGYRRLWREKAAKKEGRRQLMRQVSAGSFHNLAAEGYELEVSLSQGAWDRSRERADRLRLGMAEACGSWSELLVGLEREKSEAAASELAFLQGILNSCGEAAPTPEQVVEMRQRCANAYTLLAEIAGKTMYVEPLERHPLREAWLRLMQLGPKRKRQNP